MAVPSYDDIPGKIDLREVVLRVLQREGFVQSNALLRKVGSELFNYPLVIGRVGQFYNDDHIQTVHKSVERGIQSELSNVTRKLQDSEAVVAVRGKLFINPRYDIGTHSFHSDQTRIIDRTLETLRHFNVSRIDPEIHYKSDIGIPRKERAHRTSLFGTNLPDFFSRRSEGTYGHSVTYLRQALRKLHYSGFSFNDSATIIPITTQEQGKLPFVLVSPLGSSVSKKTVMLAEVLGQLSGQKVIIKKVKPGHIRTISYKYGIGSYKNGDGWHPDYRHDDDTYPAPVWSVKELSNLKGGKFSRIREKVNKLDREHQVELVPYDREQHLLQAKKLLENWAGSLVSRHQSESRENAIEAHMPFLTETPPGEHGKDHFSFLMFLDKRPVGFTMLERIGPKTFGLYANIASTEINGVPEALVVKTAKAMDGKGVRFINAGGSEIEGLHRFKMHFNPVRLERTPHLVYYPKSITTSTHRGRAGR